MKQVQYNWWHWFMLNRCSCSYIAKPLTKQSSSRVSYLKFILFHIIFLRQFKCPFHIANIYLYVHLVFKLNPPIFFLWTSAFSYHLSGLDLCCNKKQSMTMSGIRSLNISGNVIPITWESNTNQPIYRSIYCDKAIYPNYDQTWEIWFKIFLMQLEKEQLE